MVLEENGEKNQVQLGKLEATIKSLSAELLKVCFKDFIEKYFIGLHRNIHMKLFYRQMKLSRSYRGI